jgi:hypothetical protein
VQEVELSATQKQHLTPAGWKNSHYVNDAGSQAAGLCPATVAGENPAVVSDQGRPQQQQQQQQQQ